MAYDEAFRLAAVNVSRHSSRIATHTACVLSKDYLSVCPSVTLSVAAWSVCCSQYGGRENIDQRNTRRDATSSDGSFTYRLYNLFVSTG